MPALLQHAFRDLVSGLLPWPLFVHGPPGVGKTCAALALADHVKYHRYVTAYELTGAVIDSYRRGTAFNWQPYDIIRDEDATKMQVAARLVVLDELGVRAVTDTQYEAVQRLLDMREGHPMVVISNHDAAGIARIYDDRIASRVEAGTVVKLNGDDRRTTS